MWSGQGDRHGGNRAAVALRLGCRPQELLDASASLVPFGPPAVVGRSLRKAIAAHGAMALRDYPDRSYTKLRNAIARHHGLDPSMVLPGNGAAELFTWAARDAALCGTSLLPTPGFADYQRALACWAGAWRPLRLALSWDAVFPAPFSAPAVPADAAVLWVTNPHNPTGQLWSRPSLEPLLRIFSLVIVDEAFLPMVPQGEAQSLAPLLEHHPNLVVIRSLTKLFAIAGLRLGYALGDPLRLRRWAEWRDPWPVNGLAAAAGEALMGDQSAFRRWQARVVRWVAEEGRWFAEQLAAIDGLRPLPSAANYLLVRGDAAGDTYPLESLRLALEQRHHILVRDCRSFDGLGEHWLRLALLDREGNRRLLGALRRHGALLSAGWS